MRSRSMRGRAFLIMLCASCIVAAMLARLGEAPLRAAAPPQAPKAAQATQRPEGNLAQVMRGILFPNSNVIFFTQAKDPVKDVKPSDDPSSSTDPLSDTYGGWAAVENSAIAISETANLLTIPGRLCSNGLPVPIKNADWPKFVQGLRDAGMVAYKAAQTKNQDKMLDAAGAVTEACSNCHMRYRDKGAVADRCK